MNKNQFTWLARHSILGICILGLLVVSEVHAQINDEADESESCPTTTTSGKTDGPKQIEANDSRADRGNCKSKDKDKAEPNDDPAADEEDLDDDIFDGEEVDAPDIEVNKTHSEPGRTESTTAKKSIDANNTAVDERKAPSTTPSGETRQTNDASQSANEDPSSNETESIRTLDVITIIGNQEKLERASGSAFRISSKTLDAQEHDDVHRVLKQVPGVYIRDEDGFGLRPNIGLRGASSDRSAKVSLMEDGVLMAPAPYAAPAAYYFPLTTRLKGMEVFKGPSAIKYGPNTIGGALNFTTRPSVARGNKGTIDVAMGSYGAQKVHVFFGQGFSNFGYVPGGRSSRQRWV